MTTLKNFIITRPASALSMIALCVLLAAVPADGKSFWPNKKNDDNKAATTAQKTTSERTGNSQEHGRGGNAGRSGSNQENRFNPTPSVSTPRVNNTPVSTYRPNPSNDNRYKPVTSVYKPEIKADNQRIFIYRPEPVRDTKSAPVYWTQPKPTPVSAYRPGAKNDQKPAHIYKAEPKNDSQANYVYKPAPKLDDNPVVAFKPDVSRATKPMLTQRPDDKPALTHRPDAKNDNHNRPNSSYRPDNRSGRDSDKQWGPAVKYKPSSNTHYRTKIGTKYHRPSSVYYDHDKIKVHNWPKSYRPPEHKLGHYYYPDHHRYNKRPLSFGFWVFNAFFGFGRRSIYFHYGNFPYIQVTRVYETYYPEVVYVGGPIYTRGGYYLESARYKALDGTLADIRSSWISGRYDLIARHVMPDDKIAIFMDGQYDYSIDGEDFLGMTRDALSDIQTSSFVWDRVMRRDDDTVTAFATHKYFGSSGEVKTVYVSYTLDKIGGSYYIVEVGSSNNPLD